MNLPWFRFYAEFSSDPVVQSLAFEDQRHYVVILCLKCAGVIDRNISATSKRRIILRALGLDSVSGDEAQRRLMEVGLISKNWQPKGWDKRQFQSDLSTQRVRKSRKNKETGNVSETLPERPGNGPDTEQIQNIQEDSLRESSPLVLVSDLEDQEGSNKRLREPKSPGALAFDAYAEAYGHRYAVDPVVNAKVRGIFAQLVKRLGADDAIAVAGWYPTHNYVLYVRSGHAVDLLLRDAEKLRTEWATGRRITDTGARQADRRETTKQVFQTLMQEAASGT